MSEYRSATFWAQVEQDGRQAKVSKVTQSRPHVAKGGSLLVKLTIRVPADAFTRVPTAVVTVPEDFISAVPTEVEADDATPPSPNPERGTE